MDEPIQSGHGSFPTLSEAWFREYGTTDPSEAAKRWERWRRRHEAASRKQCLVKVCEFATGLKNISVRNWLHDDPERRHKVKKQNRVILDAIAEALDCSDLVPSKSRPEPILPGRSGNRVAVLTRLARLPSLSYHMEVIRGLVRGAEEHLFLPTLHEVREPELARVVTRVLRVLKPNAVVMVRHTPTGRNSRFSRC